MIEFLFLRVCRSVSEMGKKLIMWLGGVVEILCLCVKEKVGGLLVGR